jgi:hypothetical protein
MKVLVLPARSPRQPATALRGPDEHRQTLADLVLGPRWPGDKASARCGAAGLTANLDGAGKRARIEEAVMYPYISRVLAEQHTRDLQNDATWAYRAGLR